jgi:PKD repeat protein
VLHLELNQLEGPLPSELGQLIGLTNILLRDNHLNGQVPLALAQIGGLIAGGNQGNCQWQNNNGLFIPDTPEYRAADSDGDGVICFLELSAPPNAPPVAHAGGPYAGDEGSPVSFDGSGSSDPDGDPLTYTWDFGDGASGTGAAPVHAYADDGDFGVTLTVSDEEPLTGEASAMVTVRNVAPSITSISGPVDPVETGTPVQVLANFADPGALDTHVATIDWGDGTLEGATVSESAGSGEAAGTHAYAEPGVHTIMVVVTDDDSGSTQHGFEFAVVFDPDGGFVTGGGWIDSPPGAHRGDPNATGRATFGFVSRYANGANVPSGRTRFGFRAGDLDFQSSSYDWLVVNQGGTAAQFKGSGSVNGMSAPTGEPYRFMIWAVDDNPDTVRVRIWYEDAGEVVIYDNGVEQTVGGGSVSVHQNR